MVAHAAMPPGLLESTFGDRAYKSADERFDAYQTGATVAREYGLLLVLPFDLVAEVLSTDDPDCLELFCGVVHTELAKAHAEMPTEWDICVDHPVREDEAVGSYAIDADGEERDDWVTEARTIARDLFPAWWLSESRLDWDGFEARCGDFHLSAHQGEGGRFYTVVDGPGLDVPSVGRLTPGQAKVTAERMVHQHLSALVYQASQLQKVLDGLAEAA